MQSLKVQLEYLKKDRNSEDLNYFNELHYKIRQLQKIIEEENVEKINFLEDMKRIRRQQNDLRKEKEELCRRVKQLQESQKMYREESRRYKNELDIIKNINIDLTESQNQNTGLRNKLLQLNAKERQFSSSVEELSRIRELLKVKEDAYEQ